MLMQPLFDCYVCLEPTNERSPCECQSYVHKKCLRKLDKSFCTICKGSFTDRRCFICFKPNCVTLAGCGCRDLYVHPACMAVYEDVEIGKCNRCDQPFRRGATLSDSDSDSDVEEEDRESKCLFVNCMCVWKQIFVLALSFSISVFMCGCCNLYTYFVAFFLYVFIMVLDICLQRRCRTH